MARAHFNCLLLSIALIFVSSANGDDAKTLFDSLYGPRIKQVTATVDRADDVALAGDLVGVARKSTDTPDFVALLCNAAYDLGMKYPDGYSVAADAMDVLVQVQPEKAAVSRERQVEALTKQWRSGKTVEDRNAAGEKAVAVLMQVGEESLKQKKPADASAAYRRALAMAISIKSPTVEAIKLAMEDMQRRERIEKDKARLQERVLKDANDFAAVEELVKLFVVQLDDPAGAQPFLNRVKDEQLRKLVPLAAGEFSSLKEEEHLALGEWYRSLAGTPPQKAGVAALGRAAAHLSQYLELHAAADISRKRASLLLDEVKEGLAKLEDKGSLDRPGASSGTTAPAKLKDNQYQGLFAEVFPDRKFGKASLVEIVRRPLLGLGDSAAFVGGPKDSYSMRLTGFFEIPETADYQFTVSHDEYVAIWLGEKQIFAQGGAVVGSFSISLKKGKVPFKMEVQEGVGVFGVTMQWRYGDRPAEYVPASAFTYDPRREPKLPPMPRSAAGLVPGLQAVYFADNAYQRPVVKKVDENIDFSWGDKSPATGVPADFTATWSGYIRIPKTGEYDFKATINATARIKVGGKVVIWGDQHRNPSTEPVSLVEGLHAFDVAFNDEGGNAALRLFWKKPGDESMEIVPASVFFHAK